MPRWTLQPINEIPLLQGCDDLLALLEKQPGTDTVSIANLLRLANYGVYQWMSKLNDLQHSQMTYSVTSVLVDGYYQFILGVKLLHGHQFRPQKPDNNDR